MSYKPSYVPGDWLADCDVCGFTFKASELKDRWDGLKVCDADWETRHIADFIKAPKGEKALPWTRPEAADQFTTVTLNCDSADFVHYSKEEFELLTEVTKARVKGPVEVSETLSVLCELEVR